MSLNLQRTQMSCLLGLLDYFKYSVCMYKSAFKKYFYNLGVKVKMGNWSKKEISTLECNMKEYLKVFVRMIYTVQKISNIQYKWPKL